MLKAAIVRTVEYCARRAWTVIIAAAVLTVLSGAFAARHFAISTDIERLISPDLAWRKREIALAAAFPQRDNTILVVVDAPTAELADQASDALTQRIASQTSLVKTARQLGGGEFFARNGLLFLPVEDVGRTAGQLTAAQPLLGRLAGDPSLRGVMEGLYFGVVSVQFKQIKLDDLERPLTMVADTVEEVLAGRPASFSWRVLMNGKPAEPRELRRFIQVAPILDFNALEPGEAASTAIRQAAADLKLASAFDARVRLTGPVAMADEEFGTLKEGALINGLATVAAVLVILWLALKSGRIILSVFLSLVVGLATTAALGLLMVGALNPISVAFAVLFIGLGVDFGIQFSVRYRSERHDYRDLNVALLNTGAKAGAPLTLAAAAVACGFLSFLPTAYRGLSELGLIAGTGMVIAFITSITLLPALIKVFNPPGEPEPIGYAALAPVDRFLERYRMAVIIGPPLVALLGLPLLLHLRFDFNPLNLRSPYVESVATFLDLKKDPNAGINAIEVLTPSLAEADLVAGKLARLPEVARTMTLSGFVPEGQQEKLALIGQANAALAGVLNPRATQPPATDTENIREIKSVSDGLFQVGVDAKGPGAEAAKRLSRLLGQLAAAPPQMRVQAEAAFVPPLKVALDQLRNMLKAEPVTLQNLPADLARDWVTGEGRARVEVAPKGDANDNETLRRFAEAVQAREPSATGFPIGILESGKTIVRAFVQAGIFALISITILLWIVLRRLGDVLLTLVPLLLAGVITLEVCVLIGLPLNFANIIALPLLLGVGVAFKIYYIMAWRAGVTNLLQSSLTRAVIWSALTTATAFGSLWLSSHPGTSSMGKLLALALVTTLCAAVLFQPALMGPPRETQD